MCQCMLKFCAVSLCLISKFILTSQASLQDWSLLLRKPYDQDPIEERGYLQEKKHNEDDEDANNPCPIARSGESAKQPWDVHSVHGIPKPWLGSNFPDHSNSEKFSEENQEQESSESNCKDENGGDVVIKILFNRDEPCNKKKLEIDQNSRYQVISKPGFNVNILKAHDST